MSTEPTKETASPHSESLFSLLYNTTSSFLQHVVALDEPSEPQVSPSSLAESTAESPQSPGDSLADYIFDLAGFHFKSATDSQPITIEKKQEQDENQDNSFSPSSKSIFDEEELKSLGFDSLPSTETVANAPSPSPDTLYHPPKHPHNVPPTESIPLLDRSLIEKLSFYLPPILRASSSIKLLYSLEKHGISLSTLFRNTLDQGPVLIAIKTNQNEIIGAFASETLSIHAGFYGNGQSFLWKVDQEDSIKVYQATGKNDYYILSQAHLLAFGGGNGQFGLWIDQDLLHASSQICDTFQNQPLANQTEFTISCLEIWGFD